MAKKTGHASHDKVLADQERIAKQGHNSDVKMDKELREMFDEVLKLDEDKKQISKRQRDIRAKAKEARGIQSAIFNQVLKELKMDSDVRTQFIHSCADVRNMIGYQFSLELVNNPQAVEEQMGAPDPIEEAGKKAANKA